MDMSAKFTPCDIGDCPFEAIGGMDCRNRCGLGVDEDIEDIDLEEIEAADLLHDYDFELISIRDPLSYNNDRDFERYSMFD